MGLMALWLAPAYVCAADADSDAAAPAEGAVLEEIVVTAEKRASTVQDTPISITAVSGADLVERGIVDFATLASQTPGISMRNNGPGQTEFEMRGMTSSGGNSPTVGFYLDDVPMTSPAQAQNGKVVIDPSLYDLNRAEMLRGPQGTLYGAGSMGGTVKLVTNQPDTQAFHAVR
jgi:iron complex outermembrane receptor protein